MFAGAVPDLTSRSLLVTSLRGLDSCCAGSVECRMARRDALVASGAACAITLIRIREAGSSSRGGSVFLWIKKTAGVLRPRLSG